MGLINKVNRDHWKRLLILSIILILFTSCSNSAEHSESPSPTPLETPQSPQSCIYLAERLIDQARQEQKTDLMKQADRLLQAAARLAGSNDQILSQVGEKYRMTSPVGSGSTATWGPGSQTAKKIFEQAIGINPKNVEAHLGLARFYQNDPTARDRSAKYFLKCTELSQKFAEPFYRLSTYYHMKNDLGRAEKMAEKAIEIGTAEKDVYGIQEGHFALGLVYLAKEKFDRAEEEFKKAAVDKNNNKWACAYQGLGTLYQKMGRPKQTAEAMKTFADLNAGDPQSAFVAALQLFDAGDYEAANQYLAGALQNGGSESARVLEGYLLLFSKQFERAEAIFQNVPAADEKELGAITGLGHLDIIHKDYSKAAGRLGKVVDELKPTITRLPQLGDRQALYRWLVCKMACLGMGWVFANQNQHEKALEYFDWILSYQKSDALTLIAKGNSMSALNRLDQAKKAFTKVLADQPDNQYALAELALVLYKRGDIQKAEEKFQQVLKTGHSAYTCPHEGLGLVYLKQGKIEKAKESFNKAIEINPDIEYKKFNELAKIFIKEKNYKKARKLLEKSIENYPYDPEAKRLLESIQD